MKSGNILEPGKSIDCICNFDNGRNMELASAGKEPNIAVSLMVQDKRHRRRVSASSASCKFGCCKYARQHIGIESPWRSGDKFLPYTIKEAMRALL
jgi:hypothetical protein